MIRKVGSVLLLSFLAVAGCRKSNTEKAEHSMQKSREDVRKQREDVTKQEKDVTKEQQDVTAAKQKVEAARANLTQAVNQRAAKVDAKIDRIQQKPDPAAKQTAAKLRERSNEVKAETIALGDKTTDFDKTKKDVNDRWDQLEKDVDAAL